MELGKSGIHVFYPQPTGDVCCNTVVFDGREKVIVDPGLYHLWPYLEKSIQEETGIQAKDFSLVIHTHSHPDHMGAGSYLEREYGVPQAMSQEERDYLDGPGQGIYAWFGVDLPSVTVSRVLKEGTLELGDRALEVYLTPGHTPGSVCLHDPQHGTLVTGDLVFSRSFGRVDLAGGDPRLLAESIRRMGALDAQAIVPGHGPSVVGRDQVRNNFKYVYRLLEECGYM
ncbi:MAG: MBL fold metallo-hydrolase [Deltaproteobacteria bacterium]|jgi:glyoxylase-like metal-dependent hydrolase (beta-lactamase superfamily II)|nr:MBL fold metallo-hydrolase [Deltaproteobacteria bacterium]